MSIKILTPRKKLKPTVTFRPDEDVAAMLERAMKDHPITSRIINECCRRQLIATGYARKREATN